MGLNPNTNHDSPASNKKNPTIVVIPRPPGNYTPDPRKPGKLNKALGFDHAELLLSLSSCDKDNSFANRIMLLDVENMSLQEQIQVVSSTKVLISMRGGSSLLSVFLPKGATAVLLDRGKPFDDMLYDNIPYFHVFSVQARRQVDNIYEYDHDSVCQHVRWAIDAYDRAYRRKSLPN